MMQTLVGAPIGGGIVLGRACVLDTALIDVPRYYITSGEVAGEWARLGEITKIGRASCRERV